MQTLPTLNLLLTRRFHGWLIYSYLQIFKLIKCKWLPGESADWFFDNIMTWSYCSHRRYSMSRQKNSFSINEHAPNREPVPLSCVADAAAKLFWFVFVLLLRCTFIKTFVSVFTKLNGNLLAVCIGFEEIIDEDDFLLLYDLNTSKNLDFLITMIIADSVRPWRDGCYEDSQMTL